MSIAVPVSNSAFNIIQGKESITVYANSRQKWEVKHIGDLYILDRKQARLILLKENFERYFKEV